MSYSQTSPTFYSAASAAVQDDNWGLIRELHSVLPSPQNRHMAFRFLQDAEFHVRLSQRLKGPVSDSSGNYDTTPLTVAKLALLKILNPAWHSILDECEQQMVACNSGVPEGQTSLPWVCFLIYGGSTLRCCFPRRSPSPVNLDGNPSCWSGSSAAGQYGWTPPADLENCLSAHNCTSQDASFAPPPSSTITGTRAELEWPISYSSTRGHDEPLQASSMYGATTIGSPHDTSFSTPVATQMDGSSYPIGVYSSSSLLPELHCPPFAHLESRFSQCANYFLR